MSKFGVAELASYLKVEVATARGRLRKGKVKKNADGQYGWDSAGAMKAVGDKIKSVAPAGRPAKKAAKVVAKSSQGRARSAPKKAAKADAGAEA